MGFILYIFLIDANKKKRRQ